MVNYKHGFHAGNHADVLKHICLIYFVKSIKKLDNSILYVDTHAGSALYDLESEYMKKTKEYETGIIKLLFFKTQDPYLRFYLKVIKNINNSRKIKFYPGSPKIIQYLTNKKDELYFFEFNNSEYKILQKNFFKYTNIKVTKKDGFTFLDNKKINVKKKGIILIDPSYQVIEDYYKVIKFIKINNEQFKNKIVLIWYPIINRVDTNEFIQELKKTGISDILRIEMPIENDNDENYMTGSGLIVLNSHKKTAQNLRGTIVELQSSMQKKENKKRVIVNYLR